MSKAKNGNYGSFDAKVLDDALNKYSRKTGKKLKTFFVETGQRDYGWYRTVRINQWGDETELKTICRKIGLDFAKINFKAGQKSADRYVKNQKITGKPKESKQEYVQETLNLILEKKEAEQDMDAVIDRFTKDLGTILKAICKNTK